jgi:aldehyde:ferredoxin oxidoreductase
MAENYGWVGKILIVDLTTRATSTVATSAYVPKWIGGRALAAKLYWDEVPPTCGALDPENRLIFATGPAAGTFGAGATRTSVATKSPATVPECYQYSTPGGHWSAELKFAGFDAVVVRGRAAEPSYIWIHDGEAKILKAERLWGMTTSQTDAEIKRVWGDKTAVMLIGPAGENLIKSAVIQTNLSHATGQGGFGAVMGSKNLKAIAVQGTGGVKVSRPQQLIDFYAENVKIGGKYGGPYPISSEIYLIHKNQERLKAAGVTDAQIGVEEFSGVLSEDIDTKFNAVDGYWTKLWLGHEEQMAGTLKNKFEGCFACPACCGRAIQASDPTGKEAAPEDLNPTLTVGQQCFEYPFWAVLEGVEFGGRRMGRPTILNYASHQEMGASMMDMGYHTLWFKDAVAAGLLTKENTGLPLGNWKVGQVPLGAYNTSEFMGPKGFTYGITYRRNDYYKGLAEGEIRFLEGKAQGSAAWKKIFETYIYKPRFFTYGSSSSPSSPEAMLHGATQFRERPNDPMGFFTGGGKQLEYFMAPSEVSKAQAAVRTKWAPLLGPKSFELSGEAKTFEGKVASVIFFQNMQIEMDSMPYCGWMGYPRFYSLWTADHLGEPGVGAKMLAAITGIDRTMEENVKSFEATWTLERAIHVREGHRREHDWFTDSVFEKNKAWTSKEAFNKVLDEYYKARGWGVDTGIPTRSQLVKLGMTDVADDLEKKYGVKVPA